MKWPTDEFPNPPIPQPSESQWAEVLRNIHAGITNPSRSSTTITPYTPTPSSPTNLPKSKTRWLWLAIPTAMVGAFLGWILRPEPVIVVETPNQNPEVILVDNTPKKVEDPLAYEVIEIAKADEIEIHSVSGNVNFFIGTHPVGDGPVKAARPGDVEFHHEDSKSYGLTYDVSEPNHPPMIWSKPNR